MVTEVKKDNQTRVKFFYNDKEHRVKKEAYISGSSNLDYIEHYVRDAAGTTLAIYRDGVAKEHTIYGASRLGVYYRTGGGNSVYQLTDHLGNVRAVVQRNNGIPEAIVATDYYPGGMAMPNRDIVGDYRYDYQGQEKDRETGKNAFALRLYDARINRWIAPDPAQQYHSPYMSMGNNWVSQIDPDGAKADDYFDKETGEYLGRGGTDDIRFISKEDWSAGNLDNFTTFAPTLGIEEQVYKYYFDEYVGLPGADEVRFKGDLADAWRTGYEKTNGREIITTHFSRGSIGGDIKTKFDAVNIIVHETFSHGTDWLKFKTYDGRDSKTFWDWEKRAVNRQIKHWSWPKTSDNIKQIIYDAYGKQPYVLPVSQRNIYFGKYGID